METPWRCQRVPTPAAPALASLLRWRGAPFWHGEQQVPLNVVMVSNIHFSLLREILFLHGETLNRGAPKRQT